MFARVPTAITVRIALRPASMPFENVAELAAAAVAAIADAAAADEFADAAVAEASGPLGWRFDVVT